MDRAQHFYRANRISTMPAGGEQLEIDGADLQLRIYPDVCILWEYNSNNDQVGPITNPVSDTYFISPEDCYEAEHKLKARIDFYLSSEYLKDIKHYYDKDGNVL